ncbi:ATP-dependent DNA helicase PIF1-like protein [Tanacetum coccineum]
MEYAPNQFASKDVKPVVEIESEILRPFEPMDVDINLADADAEVEFEDTIIGVTQSSTSILTPIHVDLNKGTNVSVDPAILKKPECQKSYYQRRRQKKIAEANANMEPQTPLGAIKNLSALTCAPTHLNLSPNRVPFGTLQNIINTNGPQKNPPLQTPSSHNMSSNKENTTPLQTPHFYGSSSVGTNVSVDPGNNVGVAPTTQSRREYQKSYYERHKQKNIATDVGEDPTIQKTREYNKSYYQRHKETNNSQDDPYDFVYNGLPKEHFLLKEQPPCVICGANRIQYEFPTFCCMNGRTTLQPLDIPPELYNLFTSQCQLGKMFRKNIRAYNTNFSFASMGVNLDKRYNAKGSGVYTFRVQGGIYHKIDQLVPRDGQPRYLQLYFYDAESEFEHRLKWPNLDREIVTILSRVLAPNLYVQTFRSVGNLGPLDKYRVELTASTKEDQRLYNHPTTSEVAGIWVEGNDKITTYKRSIVVYRRSKYPTQIQAYFACYDPLSYPMFFRNGEAGWHSRIPRKGVDIRELVNDDDDIVKDEEGPRDMRKRFLDAMTLVQDVGKPDIFLTMTYNPNWPEIVENLYEGQTAQDQPDLVTRVFLAKLEYLKHQLFTKYILGVVASHIYVIEFQK